MFCRILYNPISRRNRRGIVLLVTMVLLVVLASLGYRLTSRVATQRHRNQYIIDYQSARYGCDSAVKYALATLEDINPKLISRPNEPDFSQLFALSEEEYKELLAQAVAHAQNPFKSDSDVNDVNAPNFPTDSNNIYSFRDSNDPNSGDPNNLFDPNDPNTFIIRGPYGPPWPFITEPVEFEIGTATVRIQIEDENAKYPITWALLNEEDSQREAKAGFQTFCEWMALDYQEIKTLQSQLDEIGKIKPFKLNLQPIKVVEKQQPARSTRASRTRQRPSSRRSIKTIPPTAHIADFAKLFHSSVLDTEVLARPTIESENRTESALKYMGMWGSQRVNINAATKQVLEAAFVFGGDEVEIAEEVITKRRIMPFKDIKDLKARLLRYSEPIEKCEKYITTASTFFTIKVTAVSGVAEASAVIAIIKNKETIERIAVISG